jgi:hypothetical protein
MYRSPASLSPELQMIVDHECVSGYPLFYEPLRSLLLYPCQNGLAIGPYSEGHNYESYKINSDGVNLEVSEIPDDVTLYV